MAEPTDPEIADAELHPDARVRYIQRRVQEEEGTRLTIDTIAYVLKLDRDYGEEEGGTPTA